MDINDKVKLAQNYISKGDIGKAIIIYNDFISSGNDEHKKIGYLRLGLISANKKDYIKSLEYFNNASDLGCLISKRNIARVYHLRGEIADAEKYFIELLENPENEELRFSLGLLYHQDGQYDKAITEYELCIKNFNCYMSMHNLALLYKDTGKLDEITNLYQKALKTCENITTYQALGSHYLCLYDFEKAAKVFWDGIKFVEKQDVIDVTTQYLMSLEKLLFILIYDETEEITKKLNLDNPIKNICNKLILIQEGNSKNEIFKTISNFSHSNKPKLYEISVKIQAIYSVTESLHELEIGQSLSHFTNGESLKNMIENNAKDEDYKNKLRLYNIEYMNDPTEGKILLEDEYNIKNYLKGFIKRINNNKSELLNMTATYSVSFTKRSDKLYLWRSYGKDGKGFCIKIPARKINKLNDVFDKNNRELRDIMNNKSLKFFNIKYDEKSISITKKILNIILKEIEDYRISLSDSELEEFSTLESSLGLYIKTILHLYKNNHYEEEQEVRAIEIKNISDKELLLDNREPRHLYLNTPPILFDTLGSEIIIGPKVENKIAWKWELCKILNDNNFLGNTIVRNSEVPYR